MEILKVEHLVKQYGKDDNAVLAVNDWRSGQTNKRKSVYTG